MVDANRSYELMAGRGLSLDVATYDLLIRGYCKVEKIAEALILREKISEAVLIDGSESAGKLQYVEELFCSSSEKGLQPDVWTFNSLIKGFV
ncbi:hypothetical protein CDL15_Pgr000789 [Punica granatum]|uniref:Pentatricopeptide repeat-containing protein n=1 Tax=Punica granatum TaxID=22663 RepID=A0A218W3B9_PUNGR|nr:hypothetical protein CDL15_Pgr000789 [Punica granatum]